MEKPINAHPRTVLIALGVALAAAGTRSTYARDVTFDQRVEAQRVIERVYYAHQIGATRPFDEAVPRRVLEQKVRRYLQQSVALEELWKTPVTQAALRAEIERIARDTRYPERLEEVYVALGNDPVLVQECFARPALVGRLVRNFLATDARAHAPAKVAAETLAARLKSGAQSISEPDPRRTVVEIHRGRSDVQPQSWTAPGRLSRTQNPVAIEVANAEFEAWRVRAPRQTREIGPIVAENEAFVARADLEEDDEVAKLVTYSVPKKPWDVSWNEMASRFDPLKARTVATAEPLPTPRRNLGSLSWDPTLPAGSAPCVADDTWDNGTLDDIPRARTGNVSVWTGSVMIIWSGAGLAGGTGGLYDPVTDTWTATSTVNAPVGFDRFTAVWTGEVMVVWWAQGGRYNPITDTWMPVSTVGSPTARELHTAVWTGRQMVIWGGLSIGVDVNDGGRYDPMADTWQSISVVNAPVARHRHTAIWTGKQMIVWGGSTYPSLPTTGGIYDPQTDTWTSMSSVDSPAGRSGHSAIWTGHRMIIWGSGNTGGVYDPAADTWRSTSLVDAPSGRWGHTAIWTGARMIVWGGEDVNTGLYNNTGASYAPEADVWTPVTTLNAPAAREDHTAVWTGSQMIVWGGGLNSGGRYDPAADAWTPTSVGVPDGRRYHTAVWTGNRMIVWGGETSYLKYTAGGSQYDPLLDDWQTTPGANAPEPRGFHTAVWDGDSMLIWGGFKDGGNCSATAGARYDPIAETWKGMSSEGGPTACTGTAVWTGRVMVIWNGIGGGRYDPVADRWSPVSPIGAPSSRNNYVAVWTGRVMVVWGGVGGGPFDPIYPAVGGRYDPVADTWASTSTSSISGRRDPGAAWTGEEMVVWGGYDGATVATGGRYDPVADIWRTTTTLGAPAARTRPSVTWTGSQAVVLGGDVVAGGSYDPATDTWLPTSTTNAPPRRVWHTAVWTGSHVVIWGGFSEGYYSSGGGRYAVGHSIDNDADGFSECAADCNDDDPAVNPGAVELCDGRDNNCNGLSDEVFDDADGDRHGDACDCAAYDPTAFAVPSEVQNVTWAVPTGTLQWNSGGASGSGTTFDVLRGRVSEWPTGAGPSEQCVESGSPDMTASDSQMPSTGAAFYYLVRGSNACAKGSYGRTSSGTERVSSRCP